MLQEKDSRKIMKIDVSSHSAERVILAVSLIQYSFARLLLLQSAKIIRFDTK